MVIINLELGLDWSMGICGLPSISADQILKLRCTLFTFSFIIFQIDYEVNFDDARQRILMDIQTVELLNSYLNDFLPYVKLYFTAWQQIHVFYEELNRNQPAKCQHSNL